MDPLVLPSLTLTPHIPPGPLGEAIVLSGSCFRTELLSGCVDILFTSNIESRSSYCLKSRAGAAPLPLFNVQWGTREGRWRGASTRLPLSGYTLFNGPVQIPKWEESFLVFCFTGNSREGLRKTKIIKCHSEK